MTLTASKVKCPDWDASVNFVASPLYGTYEIAIKTAKSKMIELDDVKEWHRMVFIDLIPKGFDYYAGNFRQIDSLRPCLNYECAVAGVNASTPRVVIASMEKLFSETRRSASVVELRWGTWDQKKRVFQLAVIIGELIGRFIQIHPFRDGNGRISRLLWAVALARFGVDPQCRLHPRPETTTKYGNLMASCMRGDFRPLQFEILKFLTVRRPDITT